MQRDDQTTIAPLSTNAELAITLAEVIAERDALAKELAEANHWRNRHSEEAAAYGAQSQKNWERARDLESSLAAHAKVVEAARLLMDCDAIEHATYPSVVASEEASDAFAALADALAALPADNGEKA